MERMIEELAVKKQRLLYRTDHHELLKACRETVERFNRGVFGAADIPILPEELKRELEHTIDSQGIAEDLKHVPAIIRGLDPTHIWFTRNSIMVELIGGLDHAGVVAYTDDGDDGNVAPRNDSMKLVDGLRYYDDGLREVEDFKDYLKSLQDEAIPYADWKAKQMNLPLPRKN